MNKARGLPPAGRFALAAALCSSIGQTFFIGLFGAEFRAEFGLSQSALGALYGAATLASGMMMFWLGSIADDWPMRRAIVLTIAGLAGGAALVGSAPSLVVLIGGLFLIRLCGQGLCGHLAVVAAARYAQRRRGRAIAMVTYGFIIGEALFPFLVALAMERTDWRVIWLGSGALMLVVALPVMALLAGPLGRHRVDESAAFEGDSPPPRIRRLGLFRHGGFLRVLGVVLVPPVVVTAIFLHQGTLAERLGRAIGDVASGFILYALIQGLFAYAGGWLVDRFSARALLRFSLLPAGLGLLSLSLITPQLGLWLLFAGVGMTAGLNSVISGAVWVELFGTAQLGMIRGVYAALMVVSTALGPVGLGLLFDQDVSLRSMAVVYLAYAVVVPLLLVPGIRGFASPNYS
ncbi:MAG: MFS transporter [Wenzhouxiangella sp.]|jgi:MFS family permease|nr:MFS transporter [Wenzhouxiangella sp.]